MRGRIWWVGGSILFTFVLFASLFVLLLLSAGSGPSSQWDGGYRKARRPVASVVQAPESEIQNSQTEGTQQALIAEVPVEAVAPSPAAAPAVPVDKNASNDAPPTDDSTFRITYRSGVIDRSTFGEGKSGVSDPVLLKLSEIFGWDIDFALDMHEGDSFLVIYEERYRGSGKELKILAAEFVNRGRAYRAIGFPVENGKFAYFAPTGKRLQRAFLRSPVQISSVSSPFSRSRYHPILNIWRAHNGVDYAAAPGAPVRATASGRVVSVGRNGGYGKTVVLKHLGPYSTLYAHLSRYRDGLAAGAHVEQGEVIGYVGQSGLATGPHLHYEFRVNGEHRDPLTYQPQAPDGETIAPALRDEFFRAARSYTARLDLLSGRQQVASQ